jgi:hypothetical protein
MRVEEQRLFPPMPSAQNAGMARCLIRGFVRSLLYRPFIFFEIQRARKA